ncbi:MAG: tail fiber domain-containing protein [Bacteroidota bacterium]
MKKLAFIVIASTLCFPSLDAQIKMDCDGDVGIGYMSTDPAYQLDVRGQAYVSCTPSASSGFYFTNFYSAPVLKPQWGNSAYIGLSTNKLWVTYTNYLYYDYLIDFSDISIKENIRNIESPLTAICQIKGIQYDLKREYYANSPENKMDELVESGKNKYGVVAQCIIASMLITKGDISEAVIELENLISSTNDLFVIKDRDYDAAMKQYGYLIECNPPFDIVPIWRVEYESYIQLIKLYQMEEQNEKVLQLALDLATKISPDGWYWNINRYTGDIYMQNSKYNIAAEQYELSLKGIRRIIEVQSKRLMILFEQGYMVKHSGFISWEEEALKPHAATLDEIENLITKARYNLVSIY